MRNLKALEEHFLPARKYLKYDPETGLFTWLKTNGNQVKIGDIAGRYDGIYISIGFKRKKTRAHRLAWLFVHGYFPIHHIDHKNEIKTDNRIINLREATSLENGQNKTSLNKNNTTGYTGVLLDKRDNRFYATIKLNYKKISLGGYSTAEEASRAYQAAKKDLHPFAFKNTN